VNDETKAALEGAIQKWKQIVAGTGLDHGTADCPLCELFVNNWCCGCPVNSAGYGHCQGSPYSAWRVAQEDLGNEMMPWGATNPTLIAIAKRELKFLRSLKSNRKIDVRKLRGKR